MNPDTRIKVLRAVGWMLDWPFLSNFKNPALDLAQKIEMEQIISRVVDFYSARDTKLRGRIDVKRLELIFLGLESNRINKLLDTLEGRLPASALDEIEASAFHRLKEITDRAVAEEVEYQKRVQLNARMWRNPRA